MQKHNIDRLRPCLESSSLENIFGTRITASLPISKNDKLNLPKRKIFPVSTIVLWSYWPPLSIDKSSCSFRSKYIHAQSKIAIFAVNNLKRAFSDARRTGATKMQNMRDHLAGWSVTAWRICSILGEWLPRRNEERSGREKHFVFTSAS